MRCAATKDGACWRERALVTGGDPGIGRAVAVAFAQEGADVAIAYLSERERHAG
jgi:NAD(P)-dependent dehydrogenase (short-subunit alcohol dehydrogenase family)